MNMMYNPGTRSASVYTMNQLTGLFRITLATIAMMLELRGVYQPCCVAYETFYLGIPLHVCGIVGICDGIRKRDICTWQYITCLHVILSVTIGLVAGATQWGLAGANLMHHFYDQQEKAGPGIVALIGFVQVVLNGVSVGANFADSSSLLRGCTRQGIHPPEDNQIVISELSNAMGEMTPMTHCTNNPQTNDLFSYYKSPPSYDEAFVEAPPPPYVAQEKSTEAAFISAVP